ncbi:MAG: decarboxylating 6-phosphogluconate dehydrogenase [Syntrophobacteraceae bacterium]|nr:decarboxylating 6-phosphogluconate dehydrogenase [Syntrophobacteraceae bacterium]
MQLGMIGAGRMGANMALRLIKAGHECIMYDRDAGSLKKIVDQGAKGAADLGQMITMLPAPRAVWLMVPAAIVDKVLEDVAKLLEPGDIVVDGGNSYYHDDIRRAGVLKEKSIEYVDVGVSGGVWGLERGYCMMIGGKTEAVRRLEPIFEALCPGASEIPRTSGRTGVPSPAENGYLHCGPNGAGHFVKMIHNGIEYGMMAALAEGFNILKNADIGERFEAVDAETAPLRRPEFYRYQFPLPDIAEVWRRGSVISSWLLDLTADALYKNPDLACFAGRVSDSGEGRWTLQAAIDEGVPAPVIGSALFSRFSSRGMDDFADKVLSAMRWEFGGHREKE